MSSVFDRIRSGAGRATFEADKLLRSNSVQSAIKSLKEEISQAFYRAGCVALDLYRSGRITQPELLEVCEHIAALQTQIAAREREIESIRGETYAAPTPIPGPRSACPNGHGELPPGAQFCPTCGAHAIQAPVQSVDASCPACGTAIVPGARFCRKCGAQVAEPATPSPAEQQPQTRDGAFPTPPTTAATSCPSCGAALALEARCCPECGTAMATPSLSPPSEQEPQTVEESPYPTSSVRASNQCPQCGTLLIPEAAFCPDCGHRLAESTGTVSETAAREESLPPLTPESPTEDADQMGDEWKV
jgi:uncharacterized OB-fold protein